MPGIDDGPETLQESLALAEALVQEGIRVAVATPHYNDEFVHSSAAEVQGRVYELKRELDRHNIPLCIFAGHEALIQPGLVEDIQAGRIATLNGSRYLLLELMQGNSARLCAETLLKKGLIHCIGSDAHGLHKRPPRVTDGLRRAIELVGHECVYQMVEKWPAAITNNEEYSVISSNSSGVVRVKQ